MMLTSPVLIPSRPPRRTP